MRTLDELRQFYEAQLWPCLKGLEDERKAVLTKIWWAGGAIASCVLLVLMILAAAGSDGEGTMVVLFLGGGAGLLAYAWLMKTYRSRFKETVIAPLVAFFDETLRYDAQACVPQGVYEQARIFLQRVDRYQGDDLVEGRLGQTQIRFSELHTEYKTTTTDGRGRRQTQWHTIFKGLFFCGDFHKHFSGRTVVLPDHTERLFGGLAKFFQAKNFSRDPLVRMDDPEFEKAFAVHATDQIEARYLLSPGMMKRILDFKKKTGRPVCLSFVNASVFMAVSYRKNLFEPNVFRTLLDFSVIGEYFTDLKTALDIVEELNLNTRIWSKE